MKDQAAKTGKPVDQTAKISSGTWYVDGDNCYRSAEAEEVSICLVDGRGVWTDTAKKHGAKVDVGPIADGETLSDFMKRLYPNAQLAATKPAENPQPADGVKPDEALAATGGWQMEGDNKLIQKDRCGNTTRTFTFNNGQAFFDVKAYYYENNSCTPVAAKSPPSMVYSAESFADAVAKYLPGVDLAAFDGSGVALDANGEIDLGLVVPLEVREFEGRFDANGEARLTVDAVKVTEQGFYVWVEELDQLPNGGENNPPALERRPPESAIVLNPTIATQVSDQSAERGSKITDTAKMTGLVKTIGRENVGWKAEVLLYGPIAPNPTGGCTDLDWSNAEIVAREAHEITADMIGDDGSAVLEKVGAYTIPKYGERGCYTYGELLTATGPDGSTVTVEHKPGNPTQTTLVPYGGVISTGIVPGATILPGGKATAIGIGIAVMVMTGATAELVARRRKAVK